MTSIPRERVASGVLGTSRRVGDADRFGSAPPEIEEQRCVLWRSREGLNSFDLSGDPAPISQARAHS